MWRIEFTSDKFLPFLPEDCQVNPGVYGFELALWLAKELHAQRLTTSYPNAEDWGWFIEYIHGEAEVMIGCSSICDESEGFTGRPVQWSIFVNLQRSLKQRIKGYAAESIVDSLTKGIEFALRNSGIEWQVIVER